jgi:hypothetical protein
MYAESKNFTQTTARQMPVVALRRSQFKRMFGDAGLAVGNHGEMYSRNMETYLP